MVDCYSCTDCATLLPSIFPTTASNSSSSSSSSSASAVTIKFSPKSTFSFHRNTSIGLTSRRRPRIIYAAASTGRSRSSNTTTNSPDYYKVLKLHKNAATLQEIKTSSYRALARKYHPDMNTAVEAEDKFKEISAAYEVLSDEEKRSVYDRSFWGGRFTREL